MSLPCTHADIKQGIYLQEQCDMNVREANLLKEDNPNHLLTYLQQHTTKNYGEFVCQIVKSENTTAIYGLTQFLKIHGSIKNGKK